MADRRAPESGLAACGRLAGGGLPLDQGQEALSDAALRGMTNPGTAYNTPRHRELTYPIGMAQAFKRLDADGRRAVLDDPWAFTHARRLALRGLTPCEFTCQVWTREPDRFRIDPALLHGSAGRAA